MRVQFFHDGRVVLRDKIFQNFRAAGCGDAFRANHVFHGKRNAGQIGWLNVAFFQQIVNRVGLREGVGFQNANIGAQHRLDGLDAPQHGFGHLPRRHLARAEFLMKRVNRLRMQFHAIKFSRQGAKTPSMMKNFASWRLGARKKIIQ